MRNKHEDEAFRSSKVAMSGWTGGQAGEGWTWWTVNSGHLGLGMDVCRSLSLIDFVE